MDDAEIAGSLYSPIGIKIPSPAVKVASNNDVVLEDFDSTMETSEVNILEDSFTETIELEEDDCDQDSYAFDPTDKEFLAMVNNLQVQSSRYDGLLASVVNRDTLEEGTDLRSFVEVEEFEICED